MQRRHFQAIADAINSTRRHATDEWTNSLINQVAIDVADNISQFNRNFDRTRFLDACGNYKEAE